MIFILSLNFTDQGIRGIKDAPKRAQQARDLAKKVGVELCPLLRVKRTSHEHSAMSVNGPKRICTLRGLARPGALPDDCDAGRHNLHGGMP